MAAEDVVLAGSPPVARGQEAGHHVAHVDEVEASGDERRQAAPRQLQHHLAHARRTEVVRADDAGRVHDHGVEPGPDGAPEAPLARELRQVVGARVGAGGSRRGLVDGVGAVGDAEGVDRAGVDHPAHAGRARGGRDVAHAADVGVGHEPAAVAADRDDRGEVKHDLRAGEGAGERVLVADVADHALDVEAADASQATLAVADHHPRLVAALEQRPHKVCADMPGRPRHDGGHGLGLASRAGLSAARRQWQAPTGID